MCCSPSSQTHPGSPLTSVTQRPELNTGLVPAFYQKVFLISGNSGFPPLGSCHSVH
ncbi:hypothetical protein ANANG_G00230120 [Anguilla anguilla]|uniref:Uncharacterized protein n=1 Tax=Anguilla anguilla TaxID=7936 RepID=A0A9D3RND6_ANGAN|nr:hypothetical protein ANANG_G00230120 [Anguilla anguilla]